MGQTFRVPPSYAMFAILGDDEVRDMEWGVPKPLAVERDGALVYDRQVASNVLQCLHDVADALRIGSDSTREAIRVLAWVHKKREEMKRWA